MDQQTFELLRVLQSGERSASVFAEIQRSLEPQRRALHAADDRASLADISELLEVWAEGAEPALSAAAIAHAAAIAEQDLEQSERAVGLYTRSVELDPSRSAVLDRLEAMLEQRAQHERFEAVLVKAAETLKARGEASADAAASTLRRLGKLRLQLKSDVDGAVSAYEQALELSADVELIRELADLYTRRRADGDGRQAADLYATLAEVQGAEAGLPLLERALDLVPGHVEALTLLESFIPEAERPERLKDRWVAFVKDTEDEAAASDRMIALARLSAERGEHHSVLEWVAPAAERGDAAALDLQAQALAAIQQQESGGEPSAEGKKKGEIRPATLVGFRVPASAPKSREELATAPGARKPKKARSGDTIVGFRVPEELAATPAERAADQAATRKSPLDAAFASANAKGGLGSASKPAAKPGAAANGQPAANRSASAKPASTSKPAERAQASAPAKTATPASRSTNGGLGPAIASGGKRQSPLPASATASAASAASAALVSATAPALRGGASLSPAQRSAALRKSTPPPAAEPAPVAQPPAAEPAPGVAPISLSPAAAHAAALRATTPSGEVASGAAQAAATALLRASAPPALQSSAAAAAAAALMQARPSAPSSLQRGSQPSFGHAVGAAAVQAPAAVPVPTREPERHNDELSGVRARPTFLDKRVLAIAAAAVVLIAGAIALTRGKPSTPPAASADAAPVEAPPAAPTPPPPPAAATTATASAVGSTGSTPSAAPATATPSALAAAVTPKATTAPAPVAPEPSSGRVEVQVSEIRIKGGKVKTQELLGAMTKNLKTLQHCYEEVLEDHPKTTGTLNYSFTIDKKGNPTKVKKSSGTIKDSHVLKCTQRAIEKTDFPKPAKAKPAQVTLPLEFKKS